MTDVTIEIDETFAVTDGKKWLSPNKKTEEFLNVVASPDAVLDRTVYVPDMAKAMANLALEFSKSARIEKIENDKTMELPKGAKY